MTFIVVHKKIPEIRQKQYNNLINHEKTPFAP